MPPYEAINKSNLYFNTQKYITKINYMILSFVELINLIVGYIFKDKYHNLEINH